MSYYTGSIQAKLIEKFMILYFHSFPQLLAHAVSVGGTQAEDPMEFKVIVIDQNDNKPAFTQNPFLGSVAEATKIGLSVVVCVSLVSVYVCARII